MSDEKSGVALWDWGIWASSHWPCEQSLPRPMHAAHRLWRYQSCRKQPNPREFSTKARSLLPDAKVAKNSNSTHAQKVSYAQSMELLEQGSLCRTILRAIRFLKPNSFPIGKHLPGNFNQTHLVTAVAQPYQ
eukprot:5335964-Amphidinium_carterae.3